jgi:hypothetical protein
LKRQNSFTDDSTVLLLELIKVNATSERDAIEL